MLSEDGGAFVADNEVHLDASADEYEGFCDLERYLRWHFDPDHRLGSEAALVERVGHRVADHVLGQVSPALTDRAPVGWCWD